MFDTPTAISLAGLCALVATAYSVYQILCHLRNYTEPVFQRYIIRLTFMVPVYAIASWCSLVYRPSAIYFDTIRDCYEAWIIYNFTALLLAYVGGPGAVVIAAEGKIVHPSWLHMTCCLPSMPVDGFFLRRTKQMTLQFVLLKPVLAALTLLLYAAGQYHDGAMTPTDGYFYISIVYNVCYTVALMGLLLFWVGAEDPLKPYKPLLKFVTVKTVVFLTFWQGIAISMVNSWGVHIDTEDSKALQNILICLEMLLASGAMSFAFSHKEYKMGGSTSALRLDAITHALSVRDVVGDVVHVFAPTYHDYVLYSDGGPAENVKRKKYRGQQAGEPAHRKMLRQVRQIGGSVLASVDEEMRRSKTPKVAALQRSDSATEKAMERNRNMAILLDSDSDGMDSDDEGGHKLRAGALQSSSGGGAGDAPGSGSDSDGARKGGSGRARCVRGVQPSRGCKLTAEDGSARGGAMGGDGGAGRPYPPRGHLPAGARLALSSDSEGSTDDDGDDEEKDDSEDGVSSDDEGQGPGAKGSRPMLPQRESGEPVVPATGAEMQEPGPRRASHVREDGGQAVPLDTAPEPQQVQRTGASLPPPPQHVPHPVPQLSPPPEARPQRALQAVPRLAPPGQTRPPRAPTQPTGGGIRRLKSDASAGEGWQNIDV